MQAAVATGVDQDCLARLSHCNRLLRSTTISSAGFRQNRVDFRMASARLLIVLGALVWWQSRSAERSWNEDRDIGVSESQRDAEYGFKVVQLSVGRIVEESQKNAGVEEEASLDGVRSDMCIRPRK